MYLNIEKTIAETLKSTIYIDSYLFGEYQHSTSEHVEILYFNSSCPDLDRQESQFIRYHVIVAYFGNILYQDSNVVDRKTAGKYTQREIAQRGINYLRHMAMRVENQINNF